MTSMWLPDKTKLVKVRLHAYSLRKDAIRYLQPLLAHSDAKTAEDAAAAIDALKCQNHNYFRDREHSGTVFWVVNEADRPASA